MNCLAAIMIWSSFAPVFRSPLKNVRVIILPAQDSVKRTSQFIPVGPGHFVFMRAVSWVHLRPFLVTHRSILHHLSFSCSMVTDVFSYVSVELASLWMGRCSACATLTFRHRASYPHHVAFERICGLSGPRSHQQTDRGRVHRDRGRAAVKDASMRRCWTN